MKKIKTWKKVLLAAVAVAVLCCVGGWAYVADYYHAEPDAVASAMQGAEGIEIQQQGSVTYFVPRQPVAGIIFYPGGKVQCEAYAPLLRQCAEKGILCALVRMPGNLAVLNINAANGIREAWPQVNSWYMAGHSLGGSMAAAYIAGHADGFDGLILLASYATGDISQSGLRVLSVYGSEDGVLNRASYWKNRTNLPADMTELVLEGGNHAGFGSYGAQAGDGAASMPPREQVRRTVEAIAALVMGE